MTPLVRSTPIQYQNGPLFLVERPNFSSPMVLSEKIAEPINVTPSVTAVNRSQSVPCLSVGDLKQCGICLHSAIIPRLTLYRLKSWVATRRHRLHE